MVLTSKIPRRVEDGIDYDGVDDEVTEDKVEIEGARGVDEAGASAGSWNCNNRRTFISVSQSNYSALYLGGWAACR